MTDNVFYDLGKMSTELNLIITLLNEVRTVHNAHVHGGNAASTESTGVSDQTVATAAITDLGRPTIFGSGISTEEIANRVSLCIALANNLRTLHTAHVHDGCTAGAGVTAAPTGAGNVVAGGDAPAWALAAISILPGEPRWADELLLSKQISLLVTLANELKADHNAHVHISVTTDSANSNDPTDVGKCALAAVAAL